MTQQAAISLAEVEKYLGYTPAFAVEASKAYNIFQEAEMQIVLARLDETQEIEKLGRADVGECHTFRTVKVPVSCMWLKRGTKDDKARAERFATTEGYRVFCYEGEKDPLGRARRDVQKSPKE